MEVLPKAKWLKTYKNADMADIIDDTDFVDEVQADEGEEAKAKLSLMQTINDSKH